MAQGESSKVKGTKKANRPKGSVAESQSGSGIRLPGASAIRTPRPLRSQTSGTFRLSAMEEDTINVLQYNSDNEMLQVGESSKVKGIKKANRPKGSVAESQSSSGIRLAGASAIRTPRPLRSQTSGTFRLSAMEEDTINVLQYNSDNEMLQVGESSKVKETKTANRQKGSVAESQSSSGIRLPGGSAIRSPTPLRSQTSGIFCSSYMEEDTINYIQDISDNERSQMALQSDTVSNMNVKSNEDQIELTEELHPSRKDGDFKKRKRTHKEPEIALKPGNVTAELETEAFDADSHESDDTEFSFSFPFERFCGSFEKAMMAKHKKMDDRVQDALRTSHQHVSDLMHQIQQSSFRKLDNFKRIITEEFSSLQSKFQAFHELQEETLTSWEVQTTKVNDVCTNQRQRLEAMDRTMDESVNFRT